MLRHMPPIVGAIAPQRIADSWLTLGVGEPIIRYDHVADALSVAGTDARRCRARHGRAVSSRSLCPAPPLRQHGEPRARRPVAALLTTAKRLSSRTERAEYAAAKEEQRITAELDDLPIGWFVVHPADLGELVSQDGEIDHVVIGPGGVFTIHLEHQPAAKVWVSEHKVTINGRDSDQMSQARFGRAAPVGC